MRRLLLIVVVLYVVWRVLGIVGRRRRGQDARERIGRKAVPENEASASPQEARRLVACSRCGTLVPEDRAVRGPGGKLYCKRACLEPASGGTESQHDGGTLPPPTRQT